MNEKAELDQYFLQLERENKFSGAVLMTLGDQVLFSGAYGYASRNWKVRNTLDIRFDTASITKLFTAVAALQLIDQGKVALDTRVVDFLDLQGTTLSREVTVFHLLTHSSGIADDADEEAGESYEDLWKTKPNYSVTEAVDFIPQFAYKPANFPPGQGCRYCNCGYVLLGLLIEKASGMKYRDYVQKNIFNRAGMSRSGFFRMDQVCEDVAEGSDPIRDEDGRIIAWKRNFYSYPPVGTPDGGAHVTAGDLDRFLRAAQSGELLSAEMTKAFFTPQVDHHSTEEGSVRYGYGLEFFIDQDGQIVFYEKGGINAGVSGMVRYYPKEDVNVALLSNMEDGAWEPMRTVHKMISGRQFT
jgi:CubicO group peptidase (beta-lactamase class C family)